MFCGNLIYRAEKVNPVLESKGFCFRKQAGRRSFFRKFLVIQRMALSYNDF